MISPVKIWRNQKEIKELVGQTGSLLAYTVIRVPPSGFSSVAPYAVGVFMLDKHNKFTCQIVDCDISALKTGKMFKMVLRLILEPDEDGVIVYGIKAIPTEG